MHFTYEPDVDVTTLKQGDLLAKTEQLNKLLTKYHSHYVNPEYTHFQILTQSCDLVKRGSSGCSARYITIAAVRSLDTVIERAITAEAQKQIEIDGKLFCSDAHKSRLASTISSLLNNNAKDFFYLHSVPEKGLATDSCTFLHLSIAIKADEHYGLCLNAKTIELKENFRAKLGWLVGNIYSRVGTEDFVPGALPNKDEFKEHIDSILKKHIAWIPTQYFSEFKAKAKESENPKFEEIYEKTLQVLKEKKENRINSLAAQLKREGELSDEQHKQIKAFLNSARGSRFIC